MRKKFIKHAISFDMMRSQIPLVAIIYKYTCMRAHTHTYPHSHTQHIDIHEHMHAHTHTHSCAFLVMTSKSSPVLMHLNSQISKSTFQAQE